MNNRIVKVLVIIWLALLVLMGLMLAVVNPAGALEPSYSGNPSMVVSGYYRSESCRTYPLYAHQKAQDKTEEQDYELCGMISLEPRPTLPPQVPTEKARKFQPNSGSDNSEVVSTPNSTEPPATQITQAPATQPPATEPPQNPPPEPTEEEDDDCPNKNQYKEGTEDCNAGKGND